MESLLLASVGVGLLVSGLVNDPRAAWGSWVIWSLSALLYLGISKLKPHRIERLVLAAGAALALVGVYQVAAYRLGLRGDGLVSWRPDSIARSCNILAEIMVWCGIVAYRRRVWSLFWLFVVVWLLCGSRTAYAAGALAAAVYTYLKVWPYWTLSRGQIVTIAALVIAAMTMISVVFRGVKTTNDDARLITWAVSYYAAVERPVVGLGPGSLRVILVDKTPYGKAIWHAHNTLFQAFAETGLLGVISCGFGVLGALWAVKRGNLQQPWVLMFVVALVPPLITEYLWWVPGLAVLALLISCRLRDEQPVRIAVPWWAAGLLAVAGAAAFMAHVSWSTTHWIALGLGVGVWCITESESQSRAGNRDHGPLSAIHLVGLLRSCWPVTETTPQGKFDAVDKPVPDQLRASSKTQ